MRVNGWTDKLKPLVDRNPASIEAADLTEWYATVKNAVWLGAADLRKDFPTAVNHGQDRWDFPMRRSGRTVETYTEFYRPDGFVDVIGVKK